MTAPEKLVSIPEGPIKTGPGRNNAGSWLWFQFPKDQLRPADSSHTRKTTPVSIPEGPIKTAIKEFKAI